jgi:hypothetical protein|tara:strand:- start:182 stop:496 length:315 start_codon:yes stop_codon:yes gene_type:complete
MTSEETLRSELMAVDFDDQFTEATLIFQDGSRLWFCHRVDQRWARAVDRNQQEDDSGLAAGLLYTVTTFRLNAKHLDIQFVDGSRWDEALQDLDIKAEDDQAWH